MYSYGRISLAHMYEYDPGLAKLCIQYRRNWLLTIILFLQLSFPIMLRLIAFASPSGGHAELLTGAYLDKLDWNILWAKKGARRGEGRGA